MTQHEVTSRGYPDIPAHIDLPALEHQILELWREQDTFAASLRRTEGAPTWTFYEGPPTANGVPGTHHVEARVFKDVFPRFKTMQGYHVERKAGWDCHGLPVEIAVEKELGFNGKPDIEAYGIAEFNAYCREAVQRNVDEFEQMTRRMGYWTDMAHPYRTMDAGYIESVWWALARVYERGLLVEDFRVAPYCPRCGTALSDHELAQGYETVVDPSVYVRLPITSGPYAERASILVWTTTPWTLPSNALVAVHPDVEYVIAEAGGENLVVAADLADTVLGEGWTAHQRIRGADMVGWTYERPLDIVPWPSAGHFVVAEEYVTTDEGTGLVHQATVFGADDMDSVRRNGVELINPIDTRGRFDEDLELLGGLFFKDADAVVLDRLKADGKLWLAQEYEHSYPHCWRCHTPLMYYALPTWYIRTTSIKDELLRENERTNWYPDTIKHGRYGDWLNNNIDWALSRSRYWGTPLPIWRNDADPQRMICVESLAHLSELAGRDLSGLDPHRPFIDEVTFSIEGQEGTYRRVPEVIDAWFDSGSMPFAQWGYPHAPGSQSRFEQAFPAQYICEAIDQTRGWFYSLMAVSTLVFDRNSYENVVCLGHILAEDGKKMSKHLGNVLLPMPLMEQHGADAVRWFMACSGSPWAARRIGHTALDEIVRKTLLTLWNTVAFQALYARAENWQPHADRPPVAERPLLDRWLISRTHIVIGQLTDAFENFETQRAGNVLNAFVDELSNWYVRRSRRRFWRGDDAALSTLHEVLDTLARLIAPITPFIAERIWQDIVRSVDPKAAASVHLASWPEADPERIVDGLDEQMAAARRITEMGRAARAEAGMRTRQPLRRILVPSRSWQLLGEQLVQQVCDELNVRAVEPFGGDDGQLIDHEVKPNFRSLGKKFGKRTPQVARAIEHEEPGKLVEAVSQGPATVSADGLDVTIDADDVHILERPREGWSVVNDQGETVALDLELDDELRRAGMAREVIRLIQEARKTSGLHVSDRIHLRWHAEREDLAAALEDHRDQIATEVLATEVGVDRDASRFTDADLGIAFDIQKATGE